MLYFCLLHSLIIIVFAVHDVFFSFYLLQVGYTLDYIFLLQTILRTDAQVSVLRFEMIKFCLMEILYW